jgi:hypothetical protein
MTGRCPEVIDLHSRSASKSGKEPIEHILPDLGIAVDACPYSDFGSRLTGRFDQHFEVAGADNADMSPASQ